MTQRLLYVPHVSHVCATYTRGLFVYQSVSPLVRFYFARACAHCLYYKPLSCETRS